MASISPSSPRPPPSWPSENNTTNSNNTTTTTTLRDVSFSSYLNSSEESYIRSLVESSQSLSHISRLKKAEEEEIGVFSAHKYFNGEEVDLKNPIRKSTNLRKHSDHDLVVQEAVASKTEPQTPSNYSESCSSWNSQSALLKRVQGFPSRRSRSSNNNNNKDDNIYSSSNNNSKKLQGKSTSPSFLSCCSCYDKSSVDIEDDLISTSSKTPHGKRGHTTTSINNTDNSNPFVFPPVVAAQLSSTGVKNTIHQQDENDEMNRKSLDVFGSSDIDHEHMTLERRLTMSSWDGIPRRQPAEEFTTSPVLSGTHDSCTGSYKDTESDASSDLFEIECFPPKNATCYAPSEASIEWSVVTASAAEFPTVGSDSEEHNHHRRSSGSGTRHKANPSIKMSGMLLGCKSQKAVRVAREVHRKPGGGGGGGVGGGGGGRDKFERERRQSFSAVDSFTGMTRFQAEAKLGGFGSQKQQIRQEIGVNVISPRSPRWSHSSHASELLYI